MLRHRFGSDWLGAAAIGCVMLLVGCGKPVVVEPPRPVVVAVHLEATASVNPDADGRPSPIVTRIYQLADQASFADADLNELWASEAAVLTTALIGRQEVLLPPNGTAQATFTLDPATRFIGVAAAFRDFRNAAWRQLKPVPETAGATTDFLLNISLDAKSVTAELRPRAPAEVDK